MKKTLDSHKRENQDVQETSKRAFREILSDPSKLHTRKVIVYNYIRDNGPSSTTMIAEGLGIYPSRLTEVIKNLHKVWKAIVRIEIRPCKVTGKNVFYYELASKAKGLIDLDNIDN